MAKKKKLKRAIRARAEAERISYQEARRRMGIGASTSGDRHAAIARVAADCLRQAKEPPSDVARVAALIADRVWRARTTWGNRDDGSMDVSFARARELAATVCDALRPQVTQEQIESTRALSFPDAVLAAPARGPKRPPTEDQLRQEVSDDELHDIAVSILAAIGPLLMQEPYPGYKGLITGAVSDHIWPPDDAEFEHMSEDGDD